MRDRFERMRAAQSRTEAEQEQPTTERPSKPENEPQEAIEKPKREIGFVAEMQERGDLDDRPIHEAIKARIEREGDVTDELLDDVMKKSDAIQDLVGLIRRQTAKGLAKYPEYFREEDFSIVEVLEHYSEEMVDGLLYVRALRKKMLRLHELIERDVLAKQKAGFNP